MQCPKCKGQLANSAKRCRYCGAPVPPGQILLEESGVVLPDPPPVEIKPSATRRAPTRSGGRLASLGDRLLALALDTALFLAGWALLLVWCAGNWGVVRPDGLSLNAALFTLSLVFCACGAFIYFWVLEGILGATLGKAIVGLEVQMVGRAHSTMRASLLRNAMRVIDGLGFYFVGFLAAIASRRRQRLGDHLAETVVVENQPRVLKQAVMATVWVLMLSGALLGAARLYTSAPARATAENLLPGFRVTQASNKISIHIDRFAVEVSWADPPPSRLALSRQQP